MLLANIQIITFIMYIQYVTFIRL